MDKRIINDISRDDYCFKCSSPTEANKTYFCVTCTGCGITFKSI